MATQTIKLFSRQLEAVKKLRDDTTNEILYGGGSRGGKSWLGNTWIMTECYEKPESSWLIARDTFTKLRDTTMNTWNKVLKAYGASGDFHFNGSTNIATNKKTGSMVYFRELGWFPSDPEYDRIGSFDLTGVFVDEAQEIRLKARDVLRGRFSVLEGNGWSTIPKAYYSCNPRKNWIMKDFVQPSDLGTLDSDKAFIRSLASDNPHVSKAYIDNLKKADKVTVERLVYGNFYYDDDPAQLIQFDKILDLYTNTHVKSGEKYITADLAFQGSDSFVIMVWDGLRVVKIKSVERNNGKEAVQIINRLKESFGVPNSNIIFDADGGGSGVSGWIDNAYEFKNGSKAKNGENYNHLKSQCYFKLAEYVNDAKIHIIDESYKEGLQEELEQVKKANVDKDGKLQIIGKDVVKERIGRSPDFSDALMMRMYFEVSGKFEAFNGNFF